MRLRIDKIYFLTPWRKGHSSVCCWVRDSKSRVRIVQVLLSDPNTGYTYDVDGYIRYNEGTNGHFLGFATDNMRVRERPTVPSVRPASKREWCAVIRAIKLLVIVARFIETTRIRSRDYKYKSVAYLFQVAHVMPAAYVVLTDRLDKMIEYVTRPDSKWTRQLEQRQLRGILGK